MLAAVMAFIGTNIDDILVLTILFSVSGRGRMKIAAGYVLGVLVMTGFSVLAAGGLNLVAGRWLRLLGLVPVVMGMRGFFRRDEEDGSVRADFLGALLITLGNGADNLGVYIPLFARGTVEQMGVYAIVFLAMAMAWGFLAARMAALPMLRRGIERHAGMIVPVVLILLGLYILLL